MVFKRRPSKGRERVRSSCCILACSKVKGQPWQRALPCCILGVGGRRVNQSTLYCKGNRDPRPGTDEPEIHSSLRYDGIQQTRQLPISNRTLNSIPLHMGNQHQQKYNPTLNHYQSGAHSVKNGLKFTTIKRNTLHSLALAVVVVDSWTYERVLESSSCLTRVAYIADLMHTMYVCI